MADDQPLDESVLGELSSLVARATPAVLKGLDAVCVIGEKVPPAHPFLTALRTACEVRKALKRRRR